MFVIVKHKSAIEVVPSAWAVLDPETQEETIYWPKKSLKAKRFNPYSQPDPENSDEWFAGKEKIIKRNFENFDDANAEADRLLSAESEISEPEYEPKRFTRKNLHQHLDREADVPQKMYNVPKRCIERIEEHVPMPEPPPDSEPSQEFQTQESPVSVCDPNNLIYILPDGTIQSVISQQDQSNYVQPMSNIENNMTEETVNILAKLSSQIRTLEEGMKLLLKGQNVKTGVCPHCFHCNSDLLNDVMTFDKIKNEEDLNKLENLLQDENYKQQFLKLCFSIIGVERTKEDLTTCCLELSKEIFDKSFWSQTTWLGTAGTGGNKFALCKHEIFIKFFKVVICKTTNTTPSKQFFAQFFQGRAKNCSQYLKASASRHPTARSKSKAAEKDIPSTQSDVLTGDI